MGGLVLGGPYGCYHLTSIRCSICAHWVNQLLVKGGNQSSSSGWTFLLEGGYSQSMIIKSFKAIQGYPNILKGFRSFIALPETYRPWKKIGGRGICQLSQNVKNIFSTHFSCQHLPVGVPTKRWGMVNWHFLRDNFGTLCKLQVQLLLNLKYIMLKSFWADIPWSYSPKYWGEKKRRCGC